VRVYGSNGHNGDRCRHSGLLLLLRAAKQHPAGLQALGVTDG
jgi:hypothetical protein